MRTGRRFDAVRSAYARRLSTLQGKSYLIPTIHLQRNESPQDVEDSLKQLVARTPNFFTGSSIVMDMLDLSTDGTPHTKPMRQDAFDEYVSVLKSMNLKPIGIANASQDIKQLAMQHDLATLMPSSGSGRWRSSTERPSTNPKPAQQPSQPQPPQPSQPPQPAQPAQPPQTPQTPQPPQPTQSPQPPQQPTTIDDEADSDQSAQTQAENSEIVIKPSKLVMESVRSGQQIYAEGCSLVILGNVGSGAEILADGDIHVYGRLQGRALAGLSGDRNSKLLCTNFQAELVSIADVYATCDSSEQMELIAGATTVVRIEDGELKFSCI